MDLYLPAEFLSLRDEIEYSGAHACSEHDSDDAMWLGGEAYVASSLFGDRPARPPRRVRRGEKRLATAEPDWMAL
ncbi:MAG: hypothetical protein ABI411_13090 [Tahibacter sp.]